MRIKLGQLDHMHLVVPDREHAARWYEQTLGFERVEEYRYWEAIPGGPLHMSADGGASGIALFEAGNGHKESSIGMGVAFKLPAKEFIEFANALGTSINLTGKDGQPLTRQSIVDLYLCYSFGFMDPYGHELELN